MIKRKRLKYIFIALALLLISAGIVATKQLNRWKETPPLYGWSPDLGIEKTASDGTPYFINNSLVSFDLDVMPADTHSHHLFSSYTEAWVYAQSNNLPVIPSVQMVHGKCKRLNDALVGRLERAIQEGFLPDDTMIGKQKALEQLGQVLLKKTLSEEAAVHVFTALELGGSTASTPAALMPKVAAEKQAFLDDPTKSRPVGFWQRTEALKHLFRQDRYLGQGFSLTEQPEPAIALARVLATEPELAAVFARANAVRAKLSNPPRFIRDWKPAGRVVEAAAINDLFEEVKTIPEFTAASAIRFGPNAGFSLSPFSQSKEYDLLVRLNALEKVITLDLIINAIKDGQLDLKPTPESGWYDYQWHALETLILLDRAQEHGKLKLTDRYKARLREAFKAAMSKNREAYINAMPPAVIGSLSGGEEEPKPIDIGPEFSAEPFATVYLRTARGYRFLQTALQTTLGDAVWNEMEQSRELEQAIRLFYGIYEQVCLELGMVVAYLPEEIQPDERRQNREVAMAWFSRIASDPDFNPDTRVAVAIGIDGNLPAKTRYVATGGIKLVQVKYEYIGKPNITGIEYRLVPSFVYLPTDLSLEFSRPLSAPLTRREFRDLCDRFDTEASLRRYLKSPVPPVSTPWQNLFGGALLTVMVIVAFFPLVSMVPLTTRRKVRRWFWILVAAILVMWLMRIAFSPGYRYKALVRYVLARNEAMAQMYSARNYGYHSEGDFPAYVPTALRDLLSDRNADVRVIASSYLYLMGYTKGRTTLLETPGLEEALRVAADDPVPEIAGYALQLLGQFGETGNAEFILSRLEEHRENQKIAIGALYGLGESALKPVFEPILSFAGDPRPGFIWATGWSLSKYTDEESVRQLIACTTSSNHRIRNATVYALGLGSQNKRYDDVLQPRVDEALLAFTLDGMNTLSYRFTSAAKTQNPNYKIRGFESLLLMPTPSREAREYYFFQRSLEALEKMSQDHPDAVEQTLKRVLKNDALAPDLKKKAERCVEVIRKRREPPVRKKKSRRQSP